MFPKLLLFCQLSISFAFFPNNHSWGTYLEADPEKNLLWFCAGSNGILAFGEKRQVCRQFCGSLLSGWFGLPRPHSSQTNLAPSQGRVASKRMMRIICIFFPKCSYQQSKKRVHAIFRFIWDVNWVLKFFCSGTASELVCVGTLFSHEAVKGVGTISKRYLCGSDTMI